MLVEGANTTSEHMETDSRKIVDNILSDMAELNYWICIADATGANGRNSFDATYDEVVTILSAIKNSSAVTLGNLGAGFQDLPDSWSPREIASEVFSSPDPIGEMMDFWIRELEDPQR